MLWIQTDFVGIQIQILVLVFIQIRIWLQIRINLDPDPTLIFNIFFKSKFTIVKKWYFGTEVLFSTSFKVSLYEVTGKF